MRNSIIYTGSGPGTLKGEFQLPFLDEFNRADGSVGRVWLGDGSVWLIYSNELIAYPTAGLNGVGNPEFTVNTALWTAFNGATLTRRDSEITPGINSGGEDKWCLEVANTGTANAQAGHSVPVVAHKWYRVSVRGYSPSANTQSGAAIVVSSGFAGPGAFDQTNEDVWETLKWGSRATGAIITIFLRCEGANAGDLVFYDAVKVEQLNLSEILNLLPESEFNVDISAGITLSGKMSAGIALNWDNQYTPANGVVFYVDGGTYYLDKCVSSVWSNVTSGALAHTPGKSLRVIKTGTTYTLMYGDFGSEVPLGVPQTISDVGIINNKHHGVFNTGDSVIDPFLLTP